MARLLSRIDRRALLVTAICIVVWRLLFQLTLVDASHLNIVRRLELYNAPGFFAAIGPNSIRFNTLSVGSVGIQPYINAWIVISLVAVISSRIKATVRDPAGRTRLQRWTRALAVAFALGEAYGFTVLDQNPAGCSAASTGRRV